MLHELSITNFAIIDELHISFDEGLNIISGETGAGKSMIIGAVSLLLGDRATAEMIRTQTDTATVEALFHIENDGMLQKKLEGMGFSAGEELVIRRMISRTGKNKAQINGQMATLANLAAISESLINICGQHEHQVILCAENHIDILDEFGGCVSARAEYQNIYLSYQQIDEQIGKLEDLHRHRAEKIDLIQFQLQEIKDINPHAGEDAELADEKKVLLNIQKLADWANRAYVLLYAENGCINEQLKEVLSAIREIQKIDSSLSLSLPDLEGSYVVLQEAALGLRDYAKNLIFDAERLSVIDDRLDLLNRLKRKHGGTLEALLTRKQAMEEELRRVSGVEEELEKLAKEKNSVAKELREKALALSKLRRQAAVLLKKAIDAEIHDLNMPHAWFFVEFLQRSPGKDNICGPKGVDEIEFYLTSNAGEEPKPLQKIASGGELSRIVLALKNVLSQTGSVATVVFDEVDSGIGGATAEIVGRKLKEVSAHHQVLCITHLPQIASFGDRHLRVVKQVVGSRTVTAVEKIDDDQKIEELSRMLGGVNVTETARDHARAMLAAAGDFFIAAETGRALHVKKSANQRR